MTTQPGKEPTMTTIDPTTCPADTPYRVRVPGIDRDVIGQRVDPEGFNHWSIPAGWNGPGGSWWSDSKVTILRPVDEPMTDWEILRKAAKIARTDPMWPTDHPVLLEIADRLEAEHKAAQEKADAETKREALYEKAVDTYRVEYGETMAFAANERAIRAVVELVLAEVVDQ